ncbi:MAG: hypothetical protein IPM54_04240 [Polyangiaceae bacterium]|nr:hypothetical protein [Polyangiaceae bacterium]
MNGNLKKLLNHTDEVATFGLSAATKKVGATVLVKVKAQDALRLEGAGLSPDIVQFGSRAVFDFVAIDHERVPLFVVQFESTSHMTDLPSAKEQHENELCRKLLLPLVRLHALHLSKKHLSSDIAGMLLETFLIAKGIISPNPAAAADKHRSMRGTDLESTGPLSMLSSGPLSTTSTGPLSLGPMSVAPTSAANSERGPMPGPFADVRKSIRRVYDAGKCRSPIPSSLMGVDLIGTHHAVGFLRITDENVACSRIALRAQLFPTSIPELVEEILIHELYHELLEVIRGRGRSVTRAELGATISTFRMRYKVKGTPASVPPAT